MKENGNLKKHGNAPASSDDIEMQLAQLQRRHDLLLNTIDDGVHGVDADGNILFENRAAAQLLGRVPGELLGQPAHTALHHTKADGSSYDIAECPIDASFRDGRARRVCGDAFWRKDGSALPVDYSVTPMENDGGKITGTLVVFRDITRAKKLEAQFLRAQRIESIGMLAGGIAHDLNNILGPILMSVDLFKGRMTEPNDLDLLETVETSARRGAEMVKQVLSFARGIEGQRMLIRPAQLLREFEKIAGETFPKSISVAVSSREDLPAMLGDPTQLHQVLLNLCVNARDAMPDGGRLTLTATQMHIDAQFAGMHPHAMPGTYLVIEVADTGTGMPPEIVAQMFNPFFTTKETGHGTGIGLSTSLAIVKSHGGFILVESAPGRGSVIRVFLPPDAAAAKPHVGESESQMPRGNGELILVIDDEAGIRSVTSRTLAEFGYRAVTAADGAEGIATYAQQSEEIAVVLTDMMMPVMDGASAIRVLKKMNPDVKIVAVTGLSAQGTEAEVAEAGVKHFLRKPYTAETMLKMLRDALLAAG